MVKLDVITTRGGDAGETSLGDGSRVRKDALRIEAMGAVDEANAVLGLLRLQTAGMRRSTRSSPASRTTCSTSAPTSASPARAASGCGWTRRSPSGWRRRSRRRTPRCRR